MELAGSPQEVRIVYHISLKYNIINILLQLEEGWLFFHGNKT